MNRKTKTVLGRARLMFAALLGLLAPALQPLTVTGALAMATVAIAAHDAAAAMGDVSCSGSSSAATPNEWCIHQAGDFSPTTPHKQSLGTATYPVQNVVSDSDSVTDQLKVGSGASVSTMTPTAVSFAGKVAVAEDSSQSAVQASSSVPVATSFEVLTSSGGNVTLTSTPNVSTTTVSVGTVLVLTGGSATATVTLQSEGALTGSGLQLGATSRAVALHKSLSLIFDGSKWVETGYVDGTH